MSKQMTVAIAGLGSRGRDTYAKAAKIYPDKMKIVAIADIDPEKVKLTAEEYDVPMSHCYESAEDMLKEEKLADVMIRSLQDMMILRHRKVFSAGSICTMKDYLQVHQLFQRQQQMRCSRVDSLQ